MTSHSDILSNCCMLLLSLTWYGSYEAFQEHLGGGTDSLLLRSITQLLSPLCNC